MAILAPIQRQLRQHTIEKEYEGVQPVISMGESEECAMPDRIECGEIYNHYPFGFKAVIGCLGDTVYSSGSNPKFRLCGSPDDVRKRLNEMRADRDMHAVVSDAETDWLASS